jgi:hypothetical protein
VLGRTILCGGDNEIHHQEAGRDQEARESQ